MIHHTVGKSTGSEGIVQIIFQTWSVFELENVFFNGSEFCKKLIDTIIGAVFPTKGAMIQHFD